MTPPRRGLLHPERLTEASIDIAGLRGCDLAADDAGVPTRLADLLPVCGRRCVRIGHRSVLQVVGVPGYGLARPSLATEQLTGLQVGYGNCFFSV